MSDTIKQESESAKAPSHLAYNVSTRNGRTFWVRIGCAWTHADGRVIQSSPPTALTLAATEKPRGHFRTLMVEVHCLGSFRPDRCQSRRCR